jgi:hypothetical protein
LETATNLQQELEQAKREAHSALLAFKDIHAEMDVCEAMQNLPEQELSYLIQGLKSEHVKMQQEIKLHLATANNLKQEITDAHSALLLAFRDIHAEKDGNAVCEAVEQLPQQQLPSMIDKLRHDIKTLKREVSVSDAATLADEAAATVRGMIEGIIKKQKLIHKHDTRGQKRVLGEIDDDKAEVQLWGEELKRRLEDS